MKLPDKLKFPPGLSRRWLIGIWAVVGILCSLGLLSYRSVQKQAEASGWVEHTYAVVTSLQQVLFNVQDADNAQRMFLVTGNTGSLGSFEEAVGNLPKRLGRIEQLINDNPSQLVQLSKLRHAIDERLANARQRIAQRQQLGIAALEPKYITPVVVELMRTVRTVVGVMVDEETRLLDGRLEQLRRARQRSVVIQAVGGLVCLVLLGLVFAGLVRQIGRAHRAERETLRTNAQLQEANAEMRAFSYSVAHDLRAPLRAINGFAQVLVEDHAKSLDEDGHRTLDRITTNAAKMDHLIDDLLALSKISVQSLHTGKVEMNELVRSVCEEVLEGAGSQRVDCKIAALPPAVGDPSLLRQVWINLIGNALKFSRGRERPQIEIGGNVAGPEFATYFIRDNGAGFDMRYADKLFGAFQRLHQAGEFEGTGIGLALVHRIIHRHGGTIWAESEEDKGAFFAFTLPEWTERRA